MKLFLTGATGYIGSHAVLELLEAGYEVVGVDNLSNSSRQPLRRVETLAGKAVPFVQADIRDRGAMEAVLNAGGPADGARPVDAVMHFAGLKAVGESTEQPIS